MALSYASKYIKKILLFKQEAQLCEMQGAFSVPKSTL